MRSHLYGERQFGLGALEGDVFRKELVQLEELENMPQLSSLSYNDMMRPKATVLDNNRICNTLNFCLPVFRAVGHKGPWSKPSSLWCFKTAFQTDQDKVLLIEGRPSCKGMCVVMFVLCACVC